MPTFSIDSPSNNHDLLFPLDRTFDVRLPPTRLDCALFTFDKDCPTFLNYLELRQRVQSGGIFDVARSDIETR